MTEAIYEKIIKDYFQSWIKKDASIIENSFLDSIIYVECYGPVYENKEQCLKWFEEWNKQGAVLEWTIKRMESIEKTCFVEWFFKCDFDGSISGFDGVSIIEFEGELISSIREFQSKSEHNYPYRDTR